MSNDILSSEQADSFSTKRQVYRKLLNGATSLFGGIRVFTYVPTIMTLMASSDSSQYNISTWLLWLVANATISASIYEYNGRRMDRLVIINALNALMCGVTTLVILYYRT